MTCFAFLAGCDQGAERGSEAEFNQVTADNNRSTLNQSTASQDRNDTRNSSGQTTLASGEGLLVDVQQEGPDQVRVGEQATMVFTVKNVSEVVLHQVRLIPLQTSPSGNQEQQPGSASAATSDSNQQNGSPQARKKIQPQNQMVQSSQTQQMGRQPIMLGTLMPGEEKKVETTITGRDEGTLRNCFAVDYTPGVCAEIEVVEPELVFTRVIVDSQGQLVQNAYVCEEVYAFYSLRNVGTGESRPVVIREDFSQGLSINGQQQFSQEIGALAAGEEWEERHLMEAQGTTSYQGYAVAQTPQSIMRSETASVNFYQPQLELILDGPSNARVSQLAHYQIIVHNPGQVFAEEVRLSMGLPNFNENAVQLNTQLERDGTNFVVGTIPPGQSRTVHVSVAYDQPGDYQIQAMADGYCVASAQELQRQLRTTVVGIPALRVDMIDTNDPVMVGETTSYRIRVMNQGSAQDTGVSLEVQLPEGLSFLSGEGDSEVTAQGQTVTIGRIEDIDPGTVVEWLIHVEATSPGKVQTHARLQSSALGRPVTVSEPTTLIRRASGSN